MYCLSLEKASNHKVHEEHEEKQQGAGYRIILIKTPTLLVVAIEPIPP
jgi:hypothetical protein